MWKLNRPANTAEATFEACISRVRNQDLKQRLESVTQAVVEASAEFDEAASHTMLHLIDQHEIVGGSVTRHEMEAVYTQRMAKKGTPGRAIYDQLMASPAHGRCPLCGQRSVSTLDHHLPKAHYPALAVAPLNLVPSCADCNKAKLDNIPQDSADETLHPYFDDIDGRRWLRAEVVQTQPAAVRFFVDPPPEWDDVLIARVVKHFETLGLGRLYGAEAAEELLNIRHQLRILHANGGAATVKEELSERAASCAQVRLNAWRTATYEAFSASEWFCADGFSMDG